MTTDEIAAFCNKVLSGMRVDSNEINSFITDYCEKFEKSGYLQQIISAVYARRMDLVEMIREYYTRYNDEYALMDLIYRGRIIKQYLVKQWKHGKDVPSVKEEEQLEST
jgi:hypothetical protein